MTYSRVKHKEKSYSIPKNSTPNHHAQRIDATSVSLLNLHPTKKLPPVGKEYMCFQSDGKDRIMTKAIGCVLSINTFEKQCVVLKGILQLPRLKNHMKTIGIEQ